MRQVKQQDWGVLISYAILTIIAQPKETDEEWKIGEERDAPL